MSVAQRIKITCDNFECDASVHSGVGLMDARTISGRAGWVNTIHFLGVEMRPVLQDFCPDHRQQAFDWATWQAQNASPKPTDPTNGASS